MSILVSCPNGHTLKVDDKFAGRRGRCPKCRATVAVPASSSSSLDEDAILELLESPQGSAIGPSSANRPSKHEDAAREAETSRRSAGAHGAVKFCPHCHREVSASLHLCPHCHHYFSDPTEFTRETAHHCAECGTERIPGDEQCSVCGAEFARMG